MIRIRSVSLAYLAALAVLLSSCGGGGGMTLVRDGVPEATIVISGEASEQVRFAAQELQTYIRKCTGAELKILEDNQPLQGALVSVGNSSALAKASLRLDRLGREGYAIETFGGNLALVGKDDDGTEFAVYEFLERFLGVRWFWPGELGEVTPESKSLVLDSVNISKTPDFAWRDRGPGGALWGATSGPTDMRGRELVIGITPEHQAEVRLWERRNKWGGLKIYGGHCLGEVFPPEKYAETHPEYYAWVNGRRAVPGKDYNYKHNGQVCTTEPGVIETFVEWTRNFFDQNPEYDGVHLTMNDGGGFCECDRCRALDSAQVLTRPGIDAEEARRLAARRTVITDRIFACMNQVAAEVEKTHPGKHVVSMAYSRYIEPPEKIEIHPLVVPQYCLWSAYRHASPEFREMHRRIAGGWAEAAKRKGIYEYDINGSWPGLHRIVMPFVADSIRFLHNHGYDLYQTQSGSEFAINGMNYYVAGKLLWDVNHDEREILEDFYEKAFGAGGPFVARFHQFLHEAWKSATSGVEDVSCNSLETTRLLEFLTPEVVRECWDSLNEAEKAADDDLKRNRVKFYKQGFQYTQLTVDAVERSKRLFAEGIDPMNLHKAEERLETMPGNKARDLVLDALSAWEERNAFNESLKNDYVIAYFWVRYNELTRNFVALENLRKLSKKKGWQL